MTDHKYGPNNHIVEAFIEHLKGMTGEDLARIKAAWDAARDAARYAAGDAARYAARDAAGYAAWDAAGYAAWEIQGADLMRLRGQPFFFLPMFGFADEKAVLAALQPKEGE